MIEVRPVQNEDNLDDSISVVEARQIIEKVTTLAKFCAFNHAELAKIAEVCQECCDRLERSNDDRE